MTVRILDAQLDAFLRSPTGPVGRDLERRARRVEELARTNASGQLLDVQSGDLLAGLRTRIDLEPDGLRARIGTSAIHRGFAYPTFHDRRGRPWLTNALRDGLRG